LISPLKYKEKPQLWDGHHQVTLGPSLTKAGITPKEKKSRCAVYLTAQWRS